MLARKLRKFEWQKKNRVEWWTMAEQVFDIRLFSRVENSYGKCYGMSCMVPMWNWNGPNDGYSDGRCKIHGRDEKRRAMLLLQKLALKLRGNVQRVQFKRDGLFFGPNSNFTVVSIISMKNTIKVINHFARAYFAWLVRLVCITLNYILHETRLNERNCLSVAAAYFGVTRRL